MKAELRKFASESAMLAALLLEAAALLIAEASHDLRLAIAKERRRFDEQRARELEPKAPT